MADEIVVAGYAPVSAAARAVTMPARPEPIRLAAHESALVVVDMQNAYASRGGYLDLAGFDITGTGAATAKVVQAVGAARAAGMLVIFF